jgi:hypothetical protein
VKVLFDQMYRASCAKWLPSHEVNTADEMGWSQLENGELLLAAEGAGFAIMVTGDNRVFPLATTFHKSSCSLSNRSIRELNQVAPRLRAP